MFLRVGRIRTNRAYEINNSGPPTELAVDEGPGHRLAIEGTDFKIGDVCVLIADAPWKKGVIQVLDADVS